MTLHLAAARWPIERPAGMDAWLARLDAAVADTAHDGAQLILLPEYAAMEAAAGGHPDLDAELARATLQAPDLVDGAREIAMRHGVWLLPGSLPFAEGARIVNRAPLISPEGAVRFQDKHVPTPFEAEGGISPGAPPHVFETAWGRIGIAICLDAEFPTLVRAQVEAGAWLILVPACTDTPHGANRVRIAAAARAMENQCVVALSSTAGMAPWSAALDVNHGTATVFGPVDHGFPENGVLAQGDPWAHAALDPEAVRRVRREGAVRNHADWPAPIPACAVL